MGDRGRLGRRRHGQALPAAGGRRSSRRSWTTGPLARVDEGVDRPARIPLRHEAGRDRARQRFTSVSHLGRPPFRLASADGRTTLSAGRASSPLALPPPARRAGRVDVDRFAPTATSHSGRRPARSSYSTLLAGQGGRPSRAALKRLLELAPLTVTGGVVDLLDGSSASSRAPGRARAAAGERPGVAAALARTTFKADGPAGDVGLGRRAGRARTRLWPTASRATSTVPRAARSSATALAVLAAAAAIGAAFLLAGSVTRRSGDWRRSAAAPRSATSGTLEHGITPRREDRRASPGSSARPSSSACSAGSASRARRFPPRDHRQSSRRRSSARRSTARSRPGTPAPRPVRVLGAESSARTRAARPDRAPRESSSSSVLISKKERRRTPRDRAHPPRRRCSSALCLPAAARTARSASPRRSPATSRSGRRPRSIRQLNESWRADCASARSTRGRATAAQGPSATR